MKYNVRFFVIILITFCITIAKANDFSSIVYINMDKVMNETIAGKSLIQQLEKIHKLNIKEFKKIEPSYLNAYEKLRNARDGVGMASIIGQACGGCYSQLPPQTVIEIKENKKIITCPNCSVLQFWDGVEE